MDLSIIFNVILLIFVLMLLGAVVYVPYKMIHVFIRGIFATTKKTVEVFIPAKK